MSGSKGYSKKQFFGDGYNHYDSKGNKTGESRRNWGGGFTEYDAKGRRIGESRLNWGGGYTHYDSKGRKTGETRENWGGGLNHYDAKGRKIGESTRNWADGYNHNDSTGGCYIATCVYGSYDCPEVITLRQFRDRRLKTNLPGRLFIRCYYAVSPTLVRWFGDRHWFHSFWRGRLDRMVSRLRKKNRLLEPAGKL